MGIINPAELDLKEEVVVKINRTAKVTSRGKRFRFSALVVVGDGSGHVGVGLGKANEVITAIQKGKEIAKRNIVRVCVINGTIPHTVIGKHGASKIFLKPASPGTGVVAGAAVRAPLEMLGIRDCMTKCHGSTNTLNIVKAVFNGLEQLKSREEIEAARGRTLGHSDTEIQQKLDKPAPVSTEGDADAETPEAPAEAAANEATAS